MSWVCPRVLSLGPKTQTLSDLSRCWNHQLSLPLRLLRKLIYNHWPSHFRTSSLLQSCRCCLDPSASLLVHLSLHYEQKNSRHFNCDQLWDIDLTVGGLDLYLSHFTLKRWRWKAKKKSRAGILRPLKLGCDLSRGSPMWGRTSVTLWASRCN